MRVESDYSLLYKYLVAVSCGFSLWYSLDFSFNFLLIKCSKDTILMQMPRKRCNQRSQPSHDTKGMCKINRLLYEEDKTYMFISLPLPYPSPTPPSALWRRQDLHVYLPAPPLPPPPQKKKKIKKKKKKHLASSEIVKMYFKKGQVHGASYFYIFTFYHMDKVM